MRMPWDGWVRRLAGNERAVANARAASVELGRRRVERDEVDLYLRQRLAPVVRAGAAPRPA
ncbi:hypothetical protein [Nocardioides mangrovi]|uniref:Uncharacterized protein n=1 Tax=Nocardioides mangrovi TaxID=2874580 RepID=A0ABS7U7K1_9ACTN|nr:hypothetical protein [Nocardioides mangrovi]MBZ5736860.1 hypothetical protein [Nocardioides mangrovi]